VCSTMGWEKRGKKMYYYGKQRENRRVISKYFGTGYFAELTANDEKTKKQLQIDISSENKSQRAYMLEQDHQINHINDQISLLIQGLLIIAGYHAPKGQWRKKRYEK
jgi:hypothetical protein